MKNYYVEKCDDKNIIAVNHERIIYALELLDRAYAVNYDIDNNGVVNIYVAPHRALYNRLFQAVAAEICRAAVDTANDGEIIAIEKCGTMTFRLHLDMDQFF